MAVLVNSEGMSSFVPCLIEFSESTVVMLNVCSGLAFDGMYNEIYFWVIFDLVRYSFISG